MKNRIIPRIFGAGAITAVICLQVGCKRDYTDHTKLLNTAEAHKATFTEVDSLRLNTGSVSAPTLMAGADIGDAVYVDETGHKVPKSYYVVYCDIYWRLNWIRQQLRKGAVPDEFTKKLASVRKELREATTGLSHDGNHRAADEALTLLESGWTHYQAHEDLLDAGAAISGAPWSVGTIAMQQFIDAGGLGFGAKSLANASLSPSATNSNESALASAAAGTLDTGTREPLSPRQERAIVVAMHYAGEYHREPGECAHEDWSKAVEKINKLRDQLWMMNKGNNRDNGTIISVTGSTGSSSSDPDRVLNSYMKNGTDLPSVSTPLGDPFRAAPPSTSPSSNKHSNE